MYMTADQPCATPADGELDMRRYRLNDAACRLQSILDLGQVAIDRRYGGSPTAGSAGANACAPSRAGSLGAMDDTIDRIETLLDRASGVVSTLGAL